MYTKRLPATQDIIRLSALMKRYPVTRTELVRIARMWNFKDEVISFLRLFPSSETFPNRSDLITRSEKQILRIRQEWESPNKLLN